VRNLVVDVERVVGQSNAPSLALSEDSLLVFHTPPGTRQVTLYLWTL